MLLSLILTITLFIWQLTFGLECGGNTCPVTAECCKGNMCGSTEDCKHFPVLVIPIVGVFIVGIIIGCIFVTIRRRDRNRAAAYRYEYNPSSPNAPFVQNSSL